jgi:hypothetical protein
MLTFLSYLVIFWLGIGFGFFFRRLAAMAACIAFCMLAFAPTSAAAMTKHECIHAGYGCQWSKASGGKAHGWYFTTERRMVFHDWKSRLPPPQGSPLTRPLVRQECHKMEAGSGPSSPNSSQEQTFCQVEPATGKKPAAGKSSKADAKPAPSPSSTSMSAVADAVASAFGGTDRQSSTPGSKSVPVSGIKQPVKPVKLVRNASTDAPESQGKQGISDVSKDESGQHLAGTPPAPTPRLTPGQEREEAMRRLARCPAPGLDTAEHEEGKRLLATVLAQRKAKLTEAER